jgi:hypothetical protein
MDLTGGVAGGAGRSHPPTGEVAQDRLGHDRSNLIHSAEKQHEPWIRAAHMQRPVGYTDARRDTPLPAHYNDGINAD